MTLTKEEIRAILKKMEEIGATKIDIYADILSDYGGWDVEGYYIDYMNGEEYLEDEYRKVEGLDKS